ncbi:uncharacterized protein CTHT_0060050 [Thermochaetoides thermophila DSM 1495]|uniref:Uncharacterized protein n=1 Tax=Chaetomium thermophilum (strain DSM 1495 / CBS 144.50 / IMI 039719) TaxID=759272 RepID=G0SEX6_CHATD|nr:hypothetical protein CTHT_0060050 [Thermochaetoides thermophila DSM 1495]EGS17992.1 hypothetical protein CTHT_0060050 [Thermochaetoides thermophila DSM 1495]
MRPSHPASGLRLCRTCELLLRPQSQAARRQLPRCSTSIRPFTTTPPSLKKRAEPSAAANTSQSRFGRIQKAAGEQPPDVDPTVYSLAAIDRVLRDFFSPGGVPSEQMTVAALRALTPVDLKLVKEPKKAEEQAKIKLSHHQPAEDLLEAGRTTQPQHTSHKPSIIIDKISEAAYSIVTHPDTIITRNVLEEYVRLQSRLGRPESLPQVLNLFASKPKPKVSSGAVTYVERNPESAENSIDPAIADMALDAAIEAKDLQTTIGVLENTYSSKAFLRAKLLKKALLPGFAMAGTPVALYLVAGELAKYQTALEPKVATGIAFIGGLCYVGFTATIGMVAHFSRNDQMIRVTWAPGTPLRHRWLHEEERAALDKIVCAFGFSEETRFGEEEGEDWEWLREYCLSKSMIVDAVELMPGMN